MFCPKCGANNADGVQFCTSCGAPLNQTGQSPAGYGYPGQQQPNYGTAQGAGQASSGYGYSGQQQPKYGAAQGAGQAPSGYGYSGQQQPNYGAAQGAGQTPAGYGYGGTQTAYAPQKKSMLPVIIVLAAIAVIAVIVIATMNNKDKDSGRGSGNPLVGSWSYEEGRYEYIMTFKSGGTGSLVETYNGKETNFEPIEWKITDDKDLEVTNSDGDKFVYGYSIKGDTLTLTVKDDDEETLTMTKYKESGGKDDEDIGSDPSSGSIVGSWSHTEDGMTMTFTFNSNGSGKITARYGGETASIPMEWERMGGNRVEVSYNGDEYVFEYSIRGDRLVLTEVDSGEAVEFTRER